MPIKPNSLTHRSSVRSHSMPLRPNRLAVVAFATVVSLQFCALITGNGDARAWQYGPILESGFEASEAFPEEDLLCSGIAEAVALGVQPPAPPGPVSVPEGACVADTTTLLQQHVNNVACPDIHLLPGVYEPAGLEFDFKHLRFKRKTRLWASQPGEVVLRFGISLGAQLNHPNDFDGSALHGLVIDIDDPENSVPVGVGSTTAAILFWGKTTDVQIHDVIIRGHGVVWHGIHAAQPNGLDIRRVDIERFLRFGLYLPWTAYVARAHVEDISVRRVGDPQWQNSETFTPGTDQQAIWVGFPTTLERVRVRDVSWNGIETAAHNWNNQDVFANDILMQDVDIDRIGSDHFRLGGVAIHAERITRGLKINRFCIGDKTQRGVNVEWNHYHPYQSARDLEFAHAVISSQTAGINIDYGALNSSLQNLHIRNARWSGIGMFHNYLAEECNLNPDLDPTPEVCGVENPDFCVVDPDADCGQPAWLEATPRLCPQLCNTTAWSDLTFDLPENDQLPCKLTYSHYYNQQAPVCLSP